MPPANFPTQPTAKTPSPVQDNIRAISELQRSFQNEKTLVDRIASAIAAFSGSFLFVAVHFVLITLWFIVNTAHIAGIKHFDPYPFILLCMVVSVEGVLLSTFVLMKQNLMQRRSDNRDQMNLQIDLLSEKEVTKTLQLLRAICRKLDIKDASLDAELEDMAQNTSVDDLAKTIREELPAED